MNAAINRMLWEEAKSYHKAGIYPDILSAWASAFQCWFQRKIEQEFPNVPSHFYRTTPKR